MNTGADTTYVYRHNASKDDLVVFTQIQKAPDSSKYPHASRWYNHINNKLQDRSVSCKLYDSKLEALNTC